MRSLGMFRSFVEFDEAYLMVYDLSFCFLFFVFPFLCFSRTWSWSCWEKKEAVEVYATWTWIDQEGKTLSFFLDLSLFFIFVYHQKACGNNIPSLWILSFFIWITRYSFSWLGFVWYIHMKRWTSYILCYIYVLWCLDLMIVSFFEMIFVFKLDRELHWYM